jgi:hypothetical protein
MTLKFVHADGEVLDHREYENSWGYAARIWTALFDMYCKNPAIQYDNWMDGERIKELWKLVYDDRLTEFERHVLASTFDNAVVKKEDFSQLAEKLLKFAAKHYQLGQVGHLELVASELRTAPDGVIAAFWHQTSVAEDPWYGEFGTNEEKPYNMLKGDKHWFSDFSRSSGLPAES